MTNNLYAFVEGNIVFMIADKFKLKMLNAMGHKQVEIVELSPETEIAECSIGLHYPNVKYLRFQNIEKTKYYYWILEYPSELSYEAVLEYFNEPDCDNDGSNIINNDYSND